MPAERSVCDDGGRKARDEAVFRPSRPNCVFHGSRSPIPRDAGQLVHANRMARAAHLRHNARPQESTGSCGLARRNRRRGNAGVGCVALVDTTKVRSDNTRLMSAEGYPSGQRGQTVNLLAMPS